ncbi:MAG: hypothetical protein B7X08_02880, partial [Acidocella sp. 20-63-7]
MMKFLMAILAASALVGCAASQPESQAQQSDDAACTAQADAARHQAQLARQQLKFAFASLLAVGASIVLASREQASDGAALRGLLETTGATV